MYRNSLEGFIKDEPRAIIGEIQMHAVQDTNAATTGSWEEEIEYLKKSLLPWRSSNSEIFFEYTVPRLGKRIDVVLLLEGVVFVLEFKVGEVDIKGGNLDQVLDYALDLKNFHKDSHNRPIVPVLVATETSVVSDETRMSVYDDGVYDPIVTNAESIDSIIRMVLKRESVNTNRLDISEWGISRYSPTPTIVEAARALYNHQNVAEITRNDAGENLTKTTDCILDVIEKAKARGGKSICFVTGVPGAGKTLVGLDVAIKAKDAVYLSGNGPLVEVLTEALSRDKVAQDKAKGIKTALSDAQRSVSRFIQLIPRFRQEMLNKLKTPIENGTLEFDPTKAVPTKESGFSEDDKVAIFDEAQRSWDHAHLKDWLSRGGSRGTYKKIANFPMSEGEFLIWSLNERKDWAVIVCLVGGGQEINTGEAGIGEWIRAVRESFPHWHIYISDHLTDREYAEGNVRQVLDGAPNVHFESALHLAVSMRSFRAEKLSNFVHYLLDRKVVEARKTYDEIKDRYPIVLTRSLAKAKEWLKRKGHEGKGSERYGLVVSSKAFRLKPLAIDVRSKIKVAHWFLNDKASVQSNCFLEDAATEFEIQGLELDYVGVIWDGDFRYDGGMWTHHKFDGEKWQNIKKDTRQQYQLNAYRVLLTRARQGMVICVPEGDANDSTRKPEFYDTTYAYLKSLGLQEI